MALGLLAGAGLTETHALDYQAVGVQQSGFDFDGVVENNAVEQSPPNAYTNVSQTIDATNNVFYESGLPGSANGLPTNNQISTVIGGDSFTFDLAGYGTGSGLSNNMLQIAPSEANQTLTLLTPTSFVSLAFLGFSSEAQNSNAIGNVLVTFTDSSSTLFTNALDYPDWYTGTGTPTHVEVFNSQGRVQNTTGLFNQDLVFPLTALSGGKLYASLITLSTGDQAKLVESVTFTITSSTPTDRSYVLAVAGAVPEPGTVVLAGLAAALILFRRHGSRS